MKNSQATYFFKEFKTSHSGAQAAARVRTHGTDLRLMFMSVHEMVFDNLDRLVPEKRYKTSEICGTHAWTVWGFQGQRVAAGICMSYLVRVGAVPLRHHKTRSGKGSKRYFVPIED